MNTPENLTAQVFGGKFCAGYKLVTTYKPLATTSHFHISVSKRYQRAVRSPLKRIVMRKFRGRRLLPLDSGSRDFGITP